MKPSNLLFSFIMLLVVFGFFCSVICAKLTGNDAITTNNFINKTAAQYHVDPSTVIIQSDGRYIYIRESLIGYTDKKKYNLLEVYPVKKTR